MTGPANHTPAYPLEAYGPQDPPAFNLIALWYAVGAFQDATFAAQPITGAAAHLVREAREVEEAASLCLRLAEREAETGTPHSISREEARAHLAGELADVFFMLRQIAGKGGITQHELSRAIARKLEINKARQWGAPNADGSIEHVRDGEVPRG